METIKFPTKKDGSITLYSVRGYIDLVNLSLSIDPRNYLKIATPSLMKVMERHLNFQHKKLMNVTNEVAIGLRNYTAQIFCNRLYC